MAPLDQVTPSRFYSNLPKSIGPNRYSVDPFCMLTVVGVSKLATVLLLQRVSNNSLSANGKLTTGKRVRQGIIRLTMALTAGAKLDGYEVLGLLGAGGMGEVYRARDPVLKREVAIKVLPAFVSQDPDRLRRFEQEAQAAAALNHPNILAVYHFGVFEGAPYLVSELLVGETLRQQLERGPLPVRKAIDTGVQIAHGIAAAHEKGIVHRDLKPENLFVTKDGRVKISGLRSGEADAAAG